MINEIGRLLPDVIEGYKMVQPYKEEGKSEVVYQKTAPKMVKRSVDVGSASKLRTDLSALIEEMQVSDGMTLSFHHHLRNGDYVLNLVLEAIANKGIRDLTIAASSIFPVHAPLVAHMESGVVTKIVSNYIAGPVAEAISHGKLQKAAIMQTHGGRPRAIENGELMIDVAFIAAPVCDEYGNLSGTYGVKACGSLGYATADACYAKLTVAVTDELVPYPAYDAEIGQENIDFVLKVDSIGDPKGIVSGTTKITRDPIGLEIAEQTVSVIEASGYLKNGMSFQTGAGGTSLAVAHFLSEKMAEKQIVGSFISGGITGYLVSLLEKAQFNTLMDVQCFDLEAVRSLRENKNHQRMSASKYGNPWNKGAVVDLLDVVILGATEIDLDFNVNVTTGSDGVIMGGSGGHSDTAAGAKMTVIVSQLMKGRKPIVVERVTTATTPGSTIDVLVTERGIAVNPKRADIVEALEAAGIPCVSIAHLKELAESITGTPEPVKHGDKVVAVVEYRDGSVMDVVYSVL
jgi:citrate lyase subunit alpha/citrate CoA-transferase